MEGRGKEYAIREIEKLGSYESHFSTSFLQNPSTKQVAEEREGWELFLSVASLSTTLIFIHFNVHMAPVG